MPLDAATPLRDGSGGRTLPAGQRPLRGGFPRFGLDTFLRQTVEVPGDWRLVVDGEVEQPIELGLDELLSDGRVERVLDLHCVATWSAVDLRWSGRPFRHLWDNVIVPRARPRATVAHLLAVALDGYQAAIPLEEALGTDVLLADRLNGEPVAHDHGAPLRLVLPQLYGYKNVKHLCRLSLRSQPARVPMSRWLVHPRGRVDLEERSGVGAQRLWRLLYRAVAPLFLRSVRRYQTEQRDGVRLPVEDVPPRVDRRGRT